MVSADNNGYFIVTTDNYVEVLIATGDVYRQAQELHEFAINAMISQSDMTEMTTVFQTTFGDLSKGKYYN